MTIRSERWPAGTPCWTDLVSADVAAAQSFYGAVLEWSFPPLDQDYGGYVIAMTKEKATAGIGPLPPDQQQAAWTLYLASDDADATAAAVTEHGGSVLMPPGDVGELGRMFIAADPTGSVFGVWQAGTHIGAELVNEPGGLSWEDLRSTDPETARSFFGAVFGYGYDEMPGAGPDYQTFRLPGSGDAVGGMGGLGDASEGTSSHWVVYFGVADADRAAEAATSRGGRVVQEPFDTPFGRMGALADPEGAVFWVAHTKFWAAQDAGAADGG